MKENKKVKTGWLVTAMVVILLIIDQIIKLYIKTHFCLGESVRVTDWFYIEFVENNGMAWGMSFIGKFWLSLLRLVAICVLFWYLRRIIQRGTHRKLYIYLVALVLTGAIGNMLDSIFYGLIFTASSTEYVSYMVPFRNGLCWCADGQGGGYVPLPILHLYVARLGAFLRRAAWYFLRPGIQFR